MKVGLFSFMFFSICIIILRSYNWHCISGLNPALSSDVFSTTVYLILDSSKYSQIFWYIPVIEIGLVVLYDGYPFPYFLIFLGHWSKYSLPTFINGFFSSSIRHLFSNFIPFALKVSLLCFSWSNVRRLFRSSGYSFPLCLTQTFSSLFSSSFFEGFSISQS